MSQVRFGAAGRLILCVAAVCTAHAQGTDLLAAEFARLEPLSGGTMGVAAIHLESGRAAYLNPDQSFPMASTYKVPIAVQLLRRVQTGDQSLRDMVTIEPGDLSPGSGTLSRLFDDPGLAVSLRNLLELMLLISDNSATDLCLEAAGGADAVTECMADLGVDAIRVDRSTVQLIADYIGLDELPGDADPTLDTFRALADELSDDERKAARAAFATDPRDSATPRAMARLLELIWRDEALDAEHSALLRDIMQRCETGEARLKGRMPEGTVVAHKTGTIGATTNDVGVISLPDDAGHVIVVAFVKDSDADVPARERAIAEVARAAHDYFLFNHP